MSYFLAAVEPWYLIPVKHHKWCNSWTLTKMLTLIWTNGINCVDDTSVEWISIVLLEPQKIKYFDDFFDFLNIHQLCLSIKTRNRKKASSHFRKFHQIKINLCSLLFSDIWIWQQLISIIYNKTGFFRKCVLFKCYSYGICKIILCTLCYHRIIGS